MADAGVARRVDGARRVRSRRSHCKLKCSHRRHSLVRVIVAAARALCALRFMNQVPEPATRLSSLRLRWRGRLTSEPPPSPGSVSVDRRVVAGEKALDVRTALMSFAHKRCRACTHCKSLQVDDVIKEGDAFIESRESPLVQRLAAWSGREPQVVTYGTNAGLPYGKDVAKSVVVFGPGDIAQAHQADEWVSLEELALHRAVMKKWMFE